MFEGGINLTELGLEGCFSTFLAETRSSPEITAVLKDFIDRRFYRKKYDAQQVLAQFAQTARDETDLDALTAELVRQAGTTEDDTARLRILRHSL